MSKGEQNFRSRGDSLGIATLVGVVALLAVSFSNWRAIDMMQQSLDARLGQLENRMTQLAQAPARPANTPPPQRGPDPNRVYTVKVAGAPSKGPAGAPIVIAEFSDFQ